MSRAADDATRTGSSTGDEPWLRSIAAALGTSSPRANAWVSAGTVVDDSYRIERAIGAGGMAVVYLAHDLELERPIAIKVYDVDARELSLSRVYREARAMARLADPNVLVVHGVGVHAQRVFLAMEYVDGGTLQKWLGAQPRTPREIIGMFGQCARGLAAAHAVGVVHGDFKPENVLVGSDGRPRVADFGLARMIEFEPGAVHEGFAGTARYGAPEQHAGAPADAKSDQFSFCVALQEALEKSGATLPRWTRRLLARGLATKPAERFDGMDAIVRALAHDPGRRRTMLAAGFVCVAGATAIAWPRDGPCETSGDAIAVEWNADRALAIAKAFASSEAPDAAATSERVRARLDEWTTEWIAGRRDACLATHARHEQSATLLDRRMLCLDGQRDRLAAIVGAFVTADRETVVDADDALAGLPDPAACANTERLLAIVAPPDDPGLAEAVARLRTRLAEGETALSLAKYTEAATIAREIEATDASAAYPPLAAEAALLAGQAAGGSLERTTAEATLARAYHLAIAAGSDDVARIAARAIVCAATRDKSGIDRASWWADAAASLGTRTRASTAEVLELDVCRARSRRIAGNYGEAEAILRDVLVRAAALDDADPLLVPRVHANLGRVAFVTGHAEDALHELEVALAGVLEVRPASNAVAIDIRAEMGRALERLGRNEDALALHLDELRAVTELYGPKSPHVMVAHHNVANALEGLGEHVRATEHLAIAIAIARERGDQQPTLADLLAALAHNHMVRGLEDEAIAMQREALAICVEVHGADHPETGNQHLNLGVKLEVAGKRAEAIAAHEEALRILAPISGPLDPTIGSLHGNMATMAYGLGDFARYEKHLTQAEASVVANPDSFRLQASTMGLRSYALEERGDIAGALAITRKGMDLVRDKDARLTRAFAIDLGVLEDKAGNHDAALAAFSEARDLALQTGAVALAASMEFDMAKVAWKLGKRGDARALAKHAKAVLVEQGETKDADAVATWLADH